MRKHDIVLVASNEQCEAAGRLQGAIARHFRGLPVTMRVVYLESGRPSLDSKDATIILFLATIDSLVALGNLEPAWAWPLKAERMLIRLLHCDLTNTLEFEGLVPIPNDESDVAGRGKVARQMGEAKVLLALTTLMLSLEK